MTLDDSTALTPPGTEPPPTPSYYRLTSDQKEALRLMADDAAHLLLYGGSRSGKTFLIVRSIIMRAAKFCHEALMVRFRLSHIKSTLIAQTWPAVMKACFPGLTVEHNKTEGFFLFPNGSRVWYGGVDDKERTEKILGGEFATIYLNECSQIPWASRNLVITRLAQKVEGLRNKAFYDENPPLRSHWSHRLFIEKKDPDTGKKLLHPENFNSMRLNPEGNKQNLSPTYLAELDGLSKRNRDRFKDGLFGDAGEAALWTIELLEQQTWDEDEFPSIIKVVVAIDPSGARSADDTDRDEIGIVVCGLGTDGHVYVLEDLTMKGGPAEWGKAAVNAYRRWEANAIVAETNFGGAMVKAVIMAAALDSDEPHLPVTYREVTASKAKYVRAEPIATLFEQKRAWLLPGMERLCDELTNFTTAGYIGERSPNRADAMVWGITALFGKLISEGRAANQGRNVGGVAGSNGPKVNTAHGRFKRYGKGHRSWSKAGSGGARRYWRPIRRGFTQSTCCSRQPTITGSARQTRSAGHERGHPLRPQAA